MWRFVSGSNSGDHPYLTSLNNFIGRQTWEYDPSAGTPAERAEVDELRSAFKANRLQQKHSSDAILRLQQKPQRRIKVSLPKENGSSSDSVSEERVKTALMGGMSYFEALQTDAGFFPGDYGGPMFLMPGLVITLYTAGCLHSVFNPFHIEEMVRYLRNHQNADGGFGLHIEGHSTMFGTGLSYVTLRLLGVDADDKVCVTSRAWIHAHGGATHITSWGKFWLAVLGVYSWDGLNPLPPELWLIPHSAWTGIGWLHPGRYWCHCRMVYLPMSYVYGRRATCRETPLTAQIRAELYPRPFGEVDWNAARSQCAPEDLYYPHPWLQDVLWWGLTKVEPMLLGSSLRKAALEETMRHIHYEDRNTRYVCIGPVNKALNMLCCWFEDPNGEAFKRHLPRVADYLWLAEDGMKMQGYNGSHFWDTAFSVQAIIATGLQDQFADCLRKAHDYTRNTQVVEEVEGPLDKWYRHISLGAWPFSSRDHGWPIADCTSEGLKAALLLAKMDPKAVGPPIPPERLFQAVNVILSYQNWDGGWATYENKRSFGALELINPSETFGDIMVDYTYVELSSASMTALAAFRAAHPQHRAADIARALRRGAKFIHSIQRRDGSWYGNWAVCFTYGVWFGIDALVAVGETLETSDALQRACAFLLEKQRKDGGWGESYLSSQDKVYVQLAGDTSHVVNTAWAMLGLLAAGQQRRDLQPLHAAAACLLRQQLPDGDWPQQHISGVFNRNCMISYSNYRNFFPIWALGRYRREVLGAT